MNNFKIELSYKENKTTKRETLTKRKVFEKFSEINPLLKDLEKIMMFDFN